MALFLALLCSVPFVLHAEERPTTVHDGSEWWSLRPVVRPALPVVKQTSWPRTPMDAFVLRNLEEHGVDPAPEADKRTLIRRATFDLIGLPPTPEEIDAFLADDAPDAYARLIDRLLASPHYGERWGRHWLDVVRYGESDGFEQDKLRPHAWRYRDYVIASFNQDKPYARFVKEQLAGDVLEPITRDGIAATGFLVAGPWDEIQNVGASQTEMRRAHEEQMDELIAAVSQTFLGMTINCARCHDHKFDPFTQADYYRMKAIFDGVDHGNRPLFTPQEQAAYDAAVAPIRERIEGIESELKHVREDPGTDLPEDAAQQALTEGRFGKALDARRARLEAKYQAAYQRPPLTVECWAKVDSKSTFNILVANSNKDSNDHWEIYTYSGSGEFSAYLPGYTPSEIKSSVDITDGAWHYVAMVFDAQRVRLFVDGKSVKEVAVTRRETGGTAGSLYFGSYPPQKIGCDGLVDDVRISTIAREIDGVPNAPLEADEHTVGLWRFDNPEENQFADLSPANNPAVVRHTSAREMQLVAELQQQKRELADVPLPMTYAGIRKEPEPTYVLLRGDIGKQGEQVTAANPGPVRVAGAAFALPADASEAARRRKFAQWVAHPDNPLTARVMVNRMWQHHFGRGLVETPSDFGAGGARPSHPELLDWLAAEFVRSGWSIKHMHRLIMLSATYRQSSQYNAAAAESDSDNRLLWRFAPRRLEAEIVRDAMLAVSGELNPQIGGPSYQPFTITIFNTYFYHLIDPGTPKYNRRTVYRMNINTARDPMLDALDCPAPSILAPRRRNTVTTLQALALMNDSFVMRQAERFARRIRMAAGDDPQAQVTLAFRTALGRPPTADECNATVGLIHGHGLENACWVLLNSTEFLYVR